MAMVRVLEKLGCELSYNPEQTCCGQPAFNAGHHVEAKKVAEHFLDCFKDQSCIVAPSGSCVAMIRNFFPDLFKGDSRASEAASIPVYEFSEFLEKEKLLDGQKLEWEGKVSFHNSCHSLRELGLGGFVKESMAQCGCEDASPELDECCGFGGLFSIKFAPISVSMAKQRLNQLQENGARQIISNDPGCIMHLRQVAEEEGLDLEIMHYAEFLDKCLSS